MENATLPICEQFRIELEEIPFTSTHKMNDSAHYNWAVGGVAFTPFLPVSASKSFTIQVAIAFMGESY